MMKMGQSLNANQAGDLGVCSPGNLYICDLLNLPETCTFKLVFRELQFFISNWKLIECVAFGRYTPIF